MPNPVLKNVEDGQIIEINKSPFILGRGLNCDHIIASRVVSRFHCQFDKIEAGWVLRDLSTNGTMVNEVIYKTTLSPVLNENDEICLGFPAFTYKFLLDAPRATNCPVERLRALESVPTSSSPIASPGTPNSFDDGISDDVLNELANDILINTTEPPNKNSVPKAKEDPVLEDLSSSEVIPEVESQTDIKAPEQDLNPPELLRSESLLEPLVQPAKTDHSLVASEIETPPFLNCSQLEQQAHSEPLVAVSKIKTSQVSDSLQLEQQAHNLNKIVDPMAAIHPGDLVNEVIVETSSRVVSEGVNEGLSEHIPLETSSRVVSEGVNESLSEHVPVATSSTRSTYPQVIEDVARDYSAANTSLPDLNKIVDPMAVMSNSKNRGASSQSTFITTPSGDLINEVSVKTLPRNDQVIAAAPPSASCTCVVKLIANAANTSSSLPSTTTGLNIIPPTLHSLQPIINNTVRDTSKMYKHPVTTTAPGLVLRPARFMTSPQAIPGTSPARFMTAPQAIPGTTSFCIVSPQNFNKKIKVSINCPSRVSLNAPKVSCKALIMNQNQMQGLANRASPLVNLSGGLQPQPSTSGRHQPMMIRYAGTLSQMQARLLHGTTATTAVLPTSTTPVVSASMVVGCSNTTSSANMDLVTSGNASNKQPLPNNTEAYPLVEPSTSKVLPEANLPARQVQEQNQFEEMEDELMCTICANLFIKAVTLGCAHSFCQYCIDMWKKKKSDCPICRNKISSMNNTLVLDNVIAKMMENAPEDVKQQRKEAIEEREKMVKAENDAKGKQPAPRRNTGRRGRTRASNNNNARIPIVQAPLTPPPHIPPVIELDDDSTTSSDSEGAPSSLDMYDRDEWYNGVPGRYYGGYGRCYNCGERGHWANGCPFR